MSDQTAPQTDAPPAAPAPSPAPLRVADAMHRRAVSIGAHETLADAVVALQELRVKRLPVLQGGQVIGIVTDGEVRRNLPPLKEGLTPWAFASRVGRVRVREIMRQPAHTVTPETPLGAAIRTMLERHIGGLPVVDGDGGALRGMLTLTDVLRAEAKTARLRWGSVEQHMTANVVSTPADAPAHEAAAKLKISRLRVLPVLEGDVLAGLLHETDLAEALDRASAGHGDTVMGGQFFLQGTARDLMRPPAGHLRGGSPMRDALSQMLALDVHGLPVVDDDGRLLGVVTISDVLKTVLGQGQQD